MKKRWKNYIAIWMVNTKGVLLSGEKACGTTQKTMVLILSYGERRNDR